MKYLPFILTIALFFSCKKETPPPTARASAELTKLEQSLPGTAWRLDSFYSINAIKYNPKDTFPPSTNHRRYVPFNIFFDSTVIHESTVTVYQGRFFDEHLPKQFERPFGLSAVGDDVRVQFLAFDHSPLS